MRSISFSALVLLMIAGLILWAPLAWASANCAAMGPECEGPCGAAFCVTVVVSTGAGLPFISALHFQDADEPPSAIPALLELPPRASLLST